MLKLMRACVHRGESVVLRDVSVAVPIRGALALVGSGGIGKSTLLAALAGAPGTAIRSHAGEPLFAGRALDDAVVTRVWVKQHQCLNGDGTVREALQRILRLTSEAFAAWWAAQAFDLADDVLKQPVAALSSASRRLLAVIAELAPDADLYLVDEPTADMAPLHVAMVRQRLKALAERALVVVATHDRGDCLALGGQTALIAGGTIQECAPSAQFFRQPGTAAGADYVRTGGCSVPSIAQRGRGADGIWWLEAGLLGGMSRPGMVAPLEDQWRSLAAANTGLLCCLEERCSYPVAGMKEHAIAFHHIPVADMTPPTFDQALALCRATEPVLRSNRAVVVHCRGGLGRTGTALATLLIWHGDVPQTAIAKVRAAQTHAIQTDAQMRFLYGFADRIQGWHTPAVPCSTS